MSSGKSQWTRMPSDSGVRLMGCRHRPADVDEVTPRGLVGMLRYRPGDLARRLQMPALVCTAEDDRETPEETTRMITHRVPRGQLRRYPGTRFDRYRDPVRQQVVADQVVCPREHLAASRARHGAASTATGHDRP